MPLVAPGEGKNLWVLGDLYTIKVSGEDTGGAYALIEIDVKPSVGPPPHIHRRNDEAFYILEGQFSFLYGERTLAGSAGAFVHIPRGTLHTFNNIGITDGRALVLITPAGLEKFCEEFGELVTDRSAPPPPGAPDMEKLVRLARKYETQIRLPPSGED